MMLMMMPLLGENESTQVIKSQMHFLGRSSSESILRILNCGFWRSKILCSSNFLNIYQPFPALQKISELFSRCMMMKFIVAMTNISWIRLLNSWRCQILQVLLNLVTRLSWTSAVINDH